MRRRFPLMVVIVMAVVAMLLISWRLPDGAPVTLKPTATMQSYENERRPVPASIPETPAMVGEMLMPGLGRIVLAMTLLVLILVFAISDLYHLRDRLLNLIEWGEGQEWHTMLKRMVTIDAAQVTAWRKRQELRLRAKFRAMKAELLDRCQHLDRYALMTGWNAFKAHLFNWLKWLG